VSARALVSSLLCALSALRTACLPLTPAAQIRQIRFLTTHLAPVFPTRTPLPSYRVHIAGTAPRTAGRVARQGTAT